MLGVAPCLRTHGPKGGTCVRASPDMPGHARTCKANFTQNGAQSKQCAPCELDLDSAPIGGWMEGQGVPVMDRGGCVRVGPG